MNVVTVALSILKPLPIPTPEPPISAVFVFSLGYSRSEAELCRVKVKAFLNRDRISTCNFLGISEQK